MEITTRDAREDDAEFIAWVQLIAARSHLPIGFWDLLFSGDDDQRIAELAAVVRAPALSFCHWSRFRIAEVDGVAAAGLSGYEPAIATDDDLIMALTQAGEARHWSDDFLGTLGERSLPVLTCVESTPEDHWVVEWVATREAYRGRGLVRRLLTEMLERGQERGFQKAQISVMIGNDPAQRAYESVGFRPHDDKTSDEFQTAIGSPGLRRLRMDLSAFVAPSAGPKTVAP
ncbi:MAG: GNAT family N-acetyltransferase [Deltaproteobacteria bacterium]